MSYLTTTTYPPHTHLTTPTPLAPSTVLSQIQDYLTATTTQPHLHPDCLFVERQGPTFSGNASIGGVVLHQLRRVEAGLRGVWLGKVADDEQAVAGAPETEFTTKKKKRVGWEDTDMDVDSAGTLPKSNDTRLDAQIERHRSTSLSPSILRHRNPDPSAGTAEELGNYQEQLRDLGERDEWGEIGGRTNAVRNREDGKAPVVKSTSTNATAIAAGEEEEEEQRERERREREKSPLEGTWAASWAVPGSRKRKEIEAEMAEREARRKAKRERVKGEKVRRAGERREARGGGGSSGLGGGREGVAESDLQLESGAQEKAEPVAAAKNKKSRKERTKNKGANKNGSPETNGNRVADDGDVEMEDVATSNKDDEKAKAKRKAEKRRTKEKENGA